MILLIVFLKNDRIGFVGANGSGKTTLMKIIDQRIQPDEGTVTIGQTIKIGYYTQEIENTKDAGIAYMDPNEKVIDYIKKYSGVCQDERWSGVSVQYVRALFIPILATVQSDRKTFRWREAQIEPVARAYGGTECPDFR